MGFLKMLLILQMIIAHVEHKEPKWMEVLVLGGKLFMGFHTAQYINDLFLFSNSFDIANYADHRSPVEVSSSIENVIKKLEKYSLVLI